MIVRLVCNSVGIRGIARVLQIATGTVLKLIIKIANSIMKPPIPLTNNPLKLMNYEHLSGASKTSFGWRMFYAAILKK
ncbi:MAG: hypothetical protein RL115_1448 [Bacteroidota bacterium]